MGRDASRPMRARGLKHALDEGQLAGVGVAPHAGAWIETSYLFIMPLRANAVAPHAGAWIETFEIESQLKSALSRAPCGRVD